MPDETNEEAINNGSKDSDSNEENSSQKKLKFHYIKSNFFRVIHVDGVWGGVSPRLDIQMSIFSERRPIPLQLVQEINDEGELGKEIPEGTVTREGFVREVEAHLVIKLDTAEAIMVWLQNKIDKIREIQQQEVDKKKKEAEKQMDDKGDA